MDNILLTISCKNQKDFEMKQKLIEAYENVNDRKKEKFIEVIIILVNSMNE